MLFVFIDSVIDNIVMHPNKNESNRKLQYV